MSNETKETYKEKMDKKARAQRVIDENLELISEKILDIESEKAEIDKLEIKLVELGKNIVEYNRAQKTIVQDLLEIKNRVKRLEERE